MTKCYPTSIGQYKQSILRVYKGAVLRELLIWKLKDNTRYRDVLIEV